MSAPERLNVLWLMADQHHAGCRGAAAHPDVRTPHLDRLSAEGAEFTHAYCNNPICAPSRVTLLTGEPPRVHGFTGNDLFASQLPAPRNLATHFFRHGYQTALVGKGHLPRAWMEEGFEFRRFSDLCDAEPADPRTCHYFDHLVAHGLADLYEHGAPAPGEPYWGGFPSRLPYEHNLEHWTAEQALAFLRQRDRQRPFFLKVSFQRPHDPYAPSGDDNSLYDPARIALPANAADALVHRFAGKPAFQRDYVSAPRPTGCPYFTGAAADLRAALARYLALVESIDREIGRVRAALEATGEWERTVVVYLADHGDFAGEHGLISKNFGFYEAIHRIPLVVKAPSVPAGVRCSELVDTTDFWPTVCDLAGVPLPADLTGTSLRRILVGAAPGRDAVFGEWDFYSPAQATVLALRTRDWRLVWYTAAPDDGELYHCTTDPGEMHNRWRDLACTEIKATLLARLLATSGHFERRHGPPHDLARRPLLKDTPTKRLHQQGVKWSALAPSLAAPARP